MIYALIIIAGIALVLVLFAQLNNEVRIQNKQIQTFFGDLVLRVFTASKDNVGKSDFLLTSVDEYSCEEYPIVSTSITTGRQSEDGGHQLDLPIVTSDMNLSGTAAEFFVEPEAENLRMFVRLLEQPYMWVCTSDYSSVIVVVKDKTDYLREVEEGDVPPSKEEYKCPPMPIKLKKALDEKQRVRSNKISLREGKVPLCLGDNVFLGNTQYVVGCIRRGER